MKNAIIKTEHFDIQRKIVANMTSESWQNIPHVSYIYEADAGDFLTVFKLMNARRTKEDRISLNTLMLKIIAEALKKSPRMNARVSYNKHLVSGETEISDRIDISMPMILPNGKMMTVNLHDFGNRTLDEMSEYIADIRRRAEKTDINEAMFEVSFNDTLKCLKKLQFKKAVCRLIGAKFGPHKIRTLSGTEKNKYYSIPESERLTASDLEQGTVTVSNIGSVCRNSSGLPALIEIVPPQACAFAIGAVGEKALVRTDRHGEKTVHAGTVIPICICFDHRVLDFGDIVPFINELDRIFASPEILAEWMNVQKSENSAA